MKFTIASLHYFATAAAFAVVFLLAHPPGMLVSGFSASRRTVLSTRVKRTTFLSMQASSTPEEDSSNNDSFTDRRSLLWNGVAFATSLLAAPLVAPLPASADTGAEVRGTPVNAFNGLAFQYRGNDFAGLRAADLNGEPSISYADFCQKLQNGEVMLVEFLAPDGDAAYATLKDATTRIRIGEGYPIEQHDGYSSPAFAIRTVKNAGVPYKFVVPALARK